MSKRRKYQPVESSFEQIDSDSDDSIIVSKSPSQSPPRPPPSSAQWIDKYAPISTSDICINPTKLTQVRNALTSMINHTLTSRVLVLSGPSGCSKSTTAKLLAKELIDSSDCLVEYNETFDIEDFLSNCRYRIGPNLAVVLIEELPNVFHEPTLEKFRKSLQQWISYDGELPPLVICLTEIEYGEGESWYNIENTMTVDTVFGRSLASQMNVVKFNPLAVRFLNKTISNIVKNEPVFNKINKVKLKSVLDQMYKVGDIRSIISNLQLWTILNSDTVCLRENQINLFHAIGKILYSSSEFTHMNKEDVDHHSIDQVLSQFQDNLPLVNLGLLENYHILNTSQFPVQLAADITNDLSISDIGVTDIGIRSARVNLRKLTSTKRQDQIRFPKQFKMARLARTTTGQVRDYQRYITPRSSFNDLNMIDGYFLPMIYNRRYKKRYSYNRLGGKFKKIYDDEVEDESVDYDQFQDEIKRKKLEDVELDSEGELSDPISESDMKTDADSEDGFSSDPELDLLISQGRI